MAGRCPAALSNAEGSAEALRRQITPCSGRRWTATTAAEIVGAAGAPSLGLAYVGRTSDEGGMASRTTSFRTARRAAVVIALFLMGGCTAAVVASILDSQPTLVEAEPASYQLDFRCEVANGVMTARGEISNGISEQRRLRIRIWVVSAQREGYRPAVNEYVDLAPGQSVRFERSIVDAETIANDIRFENGDTCGTRVYEA